MIIDLKDDYIRSGLTRNTESFNDVEYRVYADGRVYTRTREDSNYEWSSWERKEIDLITPYEIMEGWRSLGLSKIEEYTDISSNRFCRIIRGLVVQENKVLGAVYLNAQFPLDKFFKIDYDHSIIQINTIKSGGFLRGS